MNIRTLYTLIFAAKPSKYKCTNAKPQLLRLVCAFSCALMVLLASTSAYAKPGNDDGCSSIGQSEDWRANLQALVEAVQENNLEDAKAISQYLTEICPDAPVLNYVQGKMYEKLGDKHRALFSYQKASDNTYHFAVDPGMAQKIWYARYEFEHPERTAEALDEKSSEIADLQAQSNQRLDDFQAYKAAHYSEISKLLWTGTGIAAGGLAFIGTGAALVAKNPIKIKNSTPPEYHEKASYGAGWTLVGVGSALLVSGTVLAGIYGYKYTHFETENADISYSISPTGVSFELVF